jgi:hypothetical protein
MNFLVLLLAAVWAAGEEESFLVLLLAAAVSPAGREEVFRWVQLLVAEARAVGREKFPGGCSCSRRRCVLQDGKTTFEVRLRRRKGNLVGLGAGLLK